jgi:CheY-like chemotaxis protein
MLADRLTTDAFVPSAVERGARVLVADDDPAIRTLYAELFSRVDGVGTLVAVEDGAEAVAAARVLRLDVAVLDLFMPRLDGVEAAEALAVLQPSLAIALNSSDHELLRRRADGLELPLFDKLQLDELVDWVAERAVAHRAATSRA